MPRRFDAKRSYLAERAAFGATLIMGINKKTLAG